MSERLSGIEVFVAAVDGGNFALAARRLGLTRSAVAKSIGRLEARLGTRLFQRTTRSQSLTDDGQAYYERCRRALAELDAADATFEAGRHEPAGRLRVTMPELIGRLRIAPLLLELARRHEGLSLDLSFSDRAIDVVEEGYDLAIRSGPLGDSSALAARALGRHWMGVFATPAYLEAHGRPADLAELIARPQAHRFVGYARQGLLQPWRYHDEQGAEARLDTPARLQFDSLDVVLTAGLDGLGLVRLPLWLTAQAVDDGRLVRVFDEPRPYGYPLHALWPHARALPLKTRVLIDLLAERLPAILGSPDAR